MSRLAIYLSRAKTLVMIILLLGGLIALYGWMQFRKGVRTGEIKGRSEQHNEEVQRDLKEKDGAALYRRAIEWLERK